MDEREDSAEPGFRISRVEPGGAGRRMTARGACFLAGALMVILGGLVMNDAALASLGLVAALWLPLAALVSAWNLRGLEVAAEMPERVFAEERFRPRLFLRNSRPGGHSYQLTVEQRLPGGGVMRFQAPWTPGGGHSVVELEGSVPRRGEFGGHPLRLRSEFPFGMVAAVREGMLEGRMIVMPRPVLPQNVEVWLEAEVGDEGDEPMRWRRPDGGELHGLREYRPGDPLKHIHWPSSTRGLGILVRDEDPPPSRPTEARVIFHSACDGRRLLRGDVFEGGLRLLAGLLWRMHELGIPTDWRADFTDWSGHRITGRAELERDLTGLATVKRASASGFDALVGEVERVPDDALLVVLGEFERSLWLPKLEPALRGRRWRALDGGDAKLARPLPLLTGGRRWR